MHHPVRDVLVDLFSSLLGTGSVIGERSGPGGHRAILQFMSVGFAGFYLSHQPDLVLVDFDGPGTWTIIDVKSFDACAASHIGAQHTDRSRLATHRSLERSTPGQYTRIHDLSSRMRLVTFAISATGALGVEAQALITAVSRRLGHILPSSLLDEASWAVPRVGAYVRMAATLAARRGMAAHLRDTWEDAVAPPPRQHVMQANGRPFGWHTMHAGPPPGGAPARAA